MAQIKIIKDAYIRGIMRYKGEVVEVASAEVTQYVSNETATDVTDAPEKIADRAVKKAPSKKKAK
jgi:hypothetical protein|tara:strand:- start:10963 stop:11157 length:195 start_codon:yes stop_codon:yes gene_type:complete